MSFLKIMHNGKQRWSRRNFVATIAGAGGASMLAPFTSWALEINDSKVDKLVKNTIGIDTHNHIDVPLDTDELSGPKLDLSGDMKKSGLSAIVMTFATDYKRNIQPGEAYQRFLNGLTAMDKSLTDDRIKRAFTLADVEAAHKAQQPTVIQAVEGCHFLEGKIERVEVAYKRGLRHLGLLHDSDALVPLGDVYTNPPQFNGLTDFGKQVIKEANRLGMLIDLTHGSDNTINAALKISTTPIVITHTGLNTQVGKNEFMAKMMRPRLISKTQAKRVADAGGVIGVWTHLSDSALEYAQNIRAMADAVGVDHVCIGTDTKLTQPYRSPNEKGGQPGGGPPPDANKGNPPNSNDPMNNPNDGPPQGDKERQGPPPGGGNGKRVGERTNEAWADEKTGFYFAVVDAMLKGGFNEEEIAKIGGDNYLRVFNTATKHSA